MSRRSSKANAISLFPFLAVLVCTMGALILLLLVTTRRMHKEQQQAAHIAEQIFDDFDDSLADTTPDANAFLISLHETRPAPETQPVENFSTALLPPEPIAEERPVEPENDADAFQDAMVLAEKQNQLEQLQQQLADEQKTQRELKDKIAASDLQLQSANRDDSEYHAQREQLSDMQRQEEELEERLLQKQQVLVQLQAELEDSSETTANAESLLRAQESALVSLRLLADDAQANSVAGTDQTVVEFTNATGTKRTPILVNVTAAGFEFLPSGIRVTHQNMKETPGRYNPLVAGVLAINRYRNQNSSNVQPYVLLLVRPSGGSVFYSAKSAFQEFDLHWGYELLEQDHNIAAGRRDEREAEVARDAVLKSLSKRFPDYNKYAALKEQLVEELVTNTELPSSGRSVTMLPDGTMILPGDESTELDNLPDGQKRFYAGGHAPQTQHEGYPGGADALEEQVAATDAASESTSGSTAELDNPFAIMADADAEDDAGTATGDAPLGFAATTPESADVFAEPPGNPPFGNPTFGFADTGLADGSEIDHRKLLRKRRSLSDNLGVGGRQASAEAARKKAAEYLEHGYSDATNLSRTDPREPTNWADSMTANHGPASPPGGQAGDFSQHEGEASSLANATAAADVAESSQGSSQNGSSGSPSNGGVGAGRGPATDEESFLRKFLQKVEEERDEQKPDVMLLSMLNSARKQARQQPTSMPVESVTPPSDKPLPAFTWSTGADQPPEPSTATPPASGSQAPTSRSASPASRQKQVYYVIKIHVARDQLAIGDFEPINTQGWSSDKRLALTLQAISSTMNEVWSSVRKDAAPAVRFLVDADATGIQQEIAKSLAAMNVPTRGVIQTGPGATAEQFFQADGTTEQRSAEPAEPVEPAAVDVGTRRRTSI